MTPKELAQYDTLREERAILSKLKSLYDDRIVHTKKRIEAIDKDCYFTGGSPMTEKENTGIDVISKEELDSVELVEDQVVKRTSPFDTLLMTDDNIKAIVNKLDQPVDLQKDLAARLKLFIDERIRIEMLDKGFLSDFTRRWVKEYNDLLDRLHKNLHGDKSTHLFLGKVTLAHIASELRKHRGSPKVVKRVVEDD